ncbi:MAG: ferredoxin [Rikenellaceae bacterium]|nr:ferredoxin [Rikenellaceae bacterium]
MIQFEETSRDEHLLGVAREMMTAARTAPKACGVDNLQIAVVTGDDLVPLATRMRELSTLPQRGFFARDADNLMQAGAAVLIGTRIEVLRLNCGLCGFATCALKAEQPDMPCAFNMNDLGIAVGSAAAIAADHRVDTRVMYSVGVAAGQLGLMPGCKAIFAILLSATGKNPFFDRTAAQSCKK